jgi:circadian clock protein KaiC
MAAVWSYSLGRASHALKANKMSEKRTPLPKSPTGIRGLDEITGGGFPQGRPTLVCGGTGCGKTLLSMEFLIHGATRFNEPGLFIAFEETAADLTQNVASLGFDLAELIDRQQIIIDYIHLDHSELESSGSFDLEGLFIRMEHAIAAIGAKRVVIDTVEALFGHLPDPNILRAELHRLFRWLKEKGVTAVITVEQGEGTLTRHGLEEYVSDCVIMLSQTVQDQVASRRLRVIKYRGSAHGGNSYPFLIDNRGIFMYPVTSVGLDYGAPTERISSGVAGLDEMLGGDGYYRGSSILVSGTAGTGKSSLASHFVDAACRRGERALYFAFEESPSQIRRNMRSIGINLGPWLEQGLLRFQATRPTFTGLEMHLLQMQEEIRRFDPQVVIVDPINSFIFGGNELEVKAMLLRLVDFLKLRQTTALFNILTAGGGPLEQTDVSISSIIDTWLLLREQENNGERNRGLYIIKSRGMAHSNQVREFLITNQGVVLREVVIGPDGILTGSGRLQQEAREEAARLARHQELERLRLDLITRRQVLDAKIKAMQAEMLAEETRLEYIIQQELDHSEYAKQQFADIAQSRQSTAKVTEEPDNGPESG